MGLNPTEVVCDPHADITSAAINVFGPNTKYKTCSYYVHKYIKQWAEWIGLLEN